MPKSLNCSNCAAPVDLPAATGATLGCPYCGSIMILPEELRSDPRRRGGASPSVGLTLQQVAALARIAFSLRTGNKAKAIQLYDEAFGVGPAEATDAVERMESGQPVTLSAHSHDFSSQAPTFAVTPTAARKLKVVLWVVGSVIVISIAGAVLTAAFGGFAAIMAARQAIPSTPDAPPSPPTTKPALPPAPPSPPSFAGIVMEFGSEGIGASQFKDARSVALDGEGRIYIGEYTGGRVQVFDSQGKFITQWMVDPKRALLNMSADRKGTVYVVHPGQILRYEGTTGSLLGEISKLNGTSRSEFYTEAAVTLDGTLVAISNYSTLVRIGANGQIRETIDLRSKVGEDVRFDKVTVDGTGNIYALSDRGDSIFTFAPDGRFKNRFAGSGDQPGQLRSPHSIAVDGQERIYVASSQGIQVFDRNGRYINAIGKELVMGLAINDNNEIIASERNRHRIVKYKLTK